MQDPFETAEKNPFYKFFDNLFGRKDVEFKRQLSDNSQTSSEEELRNRFSLSNPSYGGSVHGSSISFDHIFRTKKSKIDKLREMSDFPEIVEALDLVCDETVVSNDKGVTVSFNINAADKINKRKVEQINEVADHILNNVIGVNDRLWKICRRYLVEGEVYFEKILNDKKDSIIGIKLIPPFTIAAKYDGNIVKEFVHLGMDKDGEFTIQDTERTLDDNQISYIHWDDYVNGDINNPKSYLWYAIRSYNILRNVEDALVTYRMTRSVERRVFNVEVGNMPTGKAKEFIQKLISQYRKLQTFDSASGTVNQTKNLMSFNEDFWFERRNGLGSEVKNLESGMNLGELRDVDYFLRKLYKSLKIPKSRWDEKSQGGLVGGKTAQIEREELEFNAFVIRIQSRLKKLFFDLFISELRLKGFDDEFLDPSLYNFKFSKVSYFSDYKEMELLESRAQMLNMFSPYIVSTMNPNAIFSLEFVLKNYFKMSDSEYESNKTLIEKEISTGTLKRVQSGEYQNNDDIFNEVQKNQFVPPTQNDENDLENR